MKSWIQLAQQQSKIFELAIPLIIGETYTISMNSNEPFIISVGDVFVGETVDGSLEFIATNSGDVMIASYGDISMEFEIKLELGSRTEWSPAPEDGYGLDLPNGAYHIQGTEGYTTADFLNTVSGVKVHNWSETSINGTQLPLNETYDFEGVDKIDFAGDNLDFIASDPFIGIYQPILEILSKTTLDYDKSIITVNGEQLRVSEVKTTSQGSIYTSNAVMLEAKVRGDYRDLRQEKLNYSRELRHTDVDNNNIQTLDYGTFIILETEYDTSSAMTTFICYDLMVATQQEYEALPITFPTTVNTLLTSLANVCNLELDTNTYKGSNLPVNTDYWVNASYTYRDVLDHISQMTTNTIKIKNDKLHVFELEETNVQLNNFASLTIGDTYGKTNIMNISQEPQHYNVFSPLNANEIEDKKELVFSNNPIFTDDMQHWADTLLTQVKDITYNTAEFKTYHGGIFQVGDIVQVFNGQEYEDVVITQQIFNSNNVQVDLVSSLPFSFKSEYVVETDQKREGQTTYFIVDKQNGIIEGLISRVDEAEDETARLTIEVDKIETEVKNIHLGNILPNANGSEDYVGWTGDGETLYVDENMLYLQDITYGTVAIPKIIEGSKSEYGWEYYNKGTMFSSYMRVIPEELKYSFRAKTGNFKPIKFTLYEYNEDVREDSDVEPSKETIYNITSPMQYITFTHTNQNDTKFMMLGIEIATATIDSRTTLTEIMFNAREPKEWFKGADDVAIYSKSLFEQLSNKMVLMVNSDGKVVKAELGVNPDDGSYFVVSADNINLNGYTEINGKFRVNEDGTVYMQDAFVEGTINAVRGEIGNFEIEDGVLQYLSPLYQKVYDYSDMAILQGIVRLEIEPTPFMYDLYDLNNDGNFSAADMAMLQANVNGDYPIDRKIQSLVKLGTTTGEILTTVISEQGNRGKESIIRADKIETELLNVKGIGTTEINFQQKEVYIDSNNFLKVR